MIPKTTKVKNYDITYFCEEELKILKKEIFSNEIYKIYLKKNNPLIFDIGSHIGLSILYFKILYPNSRIIAFEPNPNVFPLLEENISLNNVPNVELYNFALGKKECNRDLYIDSTGIGAFSTSSFTKNAWNGKQKTIPIQVQVKQLSKYIQKEVDLLKIDIEGAELEVLEELKCNDKLKFIKNIIIEYHPMKKNNLNKIISILGNKVELKTMEEGLIIILGKKLFDN